ncbi:class III poly(R)-hydroxyalkanoic acid synthase subunit PhaC [Natrinema sp. 1APR25-10V2]|uniref:class III poly(R)-hydroxyalkanoic acid synthase subunit PhaC n=1 Tax=Natrinema sp. 1APR25-10V2 TaxID=2951081 RepID=UPI00287B95AD|nr:class III poly(R)-hydroxyalkanoic acid synthase subunit PhaC [Natrinema sp. 1APR25-10V2]
MKTDESKRIRTPLELYLSAQRTAAESAADTVRRASVLDDRIEDAASVEVGQTASDVVYRENKLALRRYEPLTAEQHDIPILIVYALINKPFILDLQPDRSVVRRLLEAGHDVYLVDWGEPSLLDASLGLDDYVNRYIDNCVDVVRERSGQERINVLGYCMGGTLAAMYTALHREKVNALALMATGLYFEDTGGVLELWGNEEYYDPRDVTETYRNVPNEFLDAGFTLMDPVANSVSKYVHLFDRLENEDFVENFARMERWLDEGVDVAGAVYAEFLEEIYQDNALYENELTVGGEHVDVRNIDMPLLQIIGKYDNLVPTAASTPFNDVVSSDDVTTIEYPTGHVGLAMSNSAHRDVWPEVAEWFLEQTSEPVLADVIGDGVEGALGVDVETDVTIGSADELEITVADEDGVIASETVRLDVTAIEQFLEGALGVEIGIDIGGEGIAVEVVSDGEVQTTVVETVGEAIRSEIEEAVEQVDIAASYDLEDLEGIGPTYAERLRTGGIESVSKLAVTDPARVADVAETSEPLAQNWIDEAHRLVEAK